MSSNSSASLFVRRPTRSTRVCLDVSFLITSLKLSLDSLNAARRSYASFDMVIHFVAMYAVCMYMYLSFVALFPEIVRDQLFSIWKLCRSGRPPA